MSQLTVTDADHLLTNNGKTHNVTKKITGYQKEAKNAKALTQVKSWLKAALINVGKPSIDGCDLSVQKADGGVMDIKVGITAADSRPAADHLFVLASELAHRAKPVAIRAFHAITEAAGYGKPLPINRGVDPVKKLSFEDNFELVAMRHKEFRKVPNPTSEELLQFERVVSKAVNRFMYINSKICRRHGLEFKDLKTYAQIWTCNYLGLYKVANPTNNDNERKLYAHLCQRFHNFVEILLKKERSCIPDPQTASVALLGKPYAGPNHGTGRRVFQQEYEGSLDEVFESEQDAEVSEDDSVMTFDPLGLDSNEVAEEDQEQKLDDAKRRKIAQARLKAEFAKLDHNTITFLLEEAVANQALCPDARSEAKRQLRLNQCSSCPKVQEQAANR